MANNNQKDKAGFKGGKEPPIYIPPEPRKKFGWGKLLAWIIGIGAVLNFLPKPAEDPPKEPEYTRGVNDRGVVPRDLVAPPAPTPAPAEAARVEVPAAVPAPAASEEIVTEAPATAAPAEAATPVTPEPAPASRAQAFGSIMAAFFQQSGSLRPDDQQRLTEKVIQELSKTSDDKAVYARTSDNNSGRAIYIAAAEMNHSGIVQAFICMEHKHVAQSFMHATAVPYEHTYKIDISPNITHKGAYKGNQLMNFADKRSCPAEVTRVELELNTPAEMKVVKTTPRLW